MALPKLYISKGRVLYINTISRKNFQVAFGTTPPHKPEVWQQLVLA